MLRMELLCATTGQRHHEFGAKEINRKFYHLKIVSPCYLFYSKHDFLKNYQKYLQIAQFPLLSKFRSEAKFHLI